MELIPLATLRKSERGVIREVDGESKFVKRLCEMGLCHGAEVQMIHAGSPCIVAVKDQRISLRSEDEIAIYVEVVQPSAVN